MTNPKTITATYRIVTPMFIGDANKNADSIRPPSIKGALRFWWRALNWSNHYRLSGNSDESALQSLHEQESKIFGNAAEDKKSKIGQSTFILHVDDSEKRKTNPAYLKNSSSGGSYLGYGNTKRNAIDCGKFTLRLAFKPKTADEDILNVKDSLIAFGLFGGLGSRSRNGFGSIAIESIDAENYVCSDIDGYKSHAFNLLEKYKTSTTPLPPYTALSKHTEISHITSAKNYTNLHNTIGQEYKDFRKGIDRKERIPFGLPLKEDPNRRASPLFIHIHPAKKSGFLGIYIHMPALFLSGNRYPGDKKISFYKEVSRLVNDGSQEVFYPCR